MKFVPRGSLGRFNAFQKFSNALKLLREVSEGVRGLQGDSVDFGSLGESQGFQGVSRRPRDLAAQGALVEFKRSLRGLRGFFRSVKAFQCISGNLNGLQ